MKKIFSLVCSLVLVLGANAGSPAQLAATAKKAVPVKVEQVQIETSQLADLDLNAAPAMKAMNKKEVKHPAIPVRKSAAKKVAAANYDVTAQYAYAYDPDYYLASPEAGYFLFGGVTPQEGVTYTLTDMDASYTGLYDGNFDPIGLATAATLQVSKKDGLPHVDATMTLNNGDSYTITYALTITDTVTVNASNLAIKDFYYGGFEYTFSDAAWTIDLVISEASAKTGTFTNIDLDYSSIVPAGGTSYDAIYVVALKENIVVSQVEDTTTLIGKIVADNGTLYVLNARYEKPDAKEITLEADTMNILTKYFSAGFFTIDGYNTDSTLQYSLYFAGKGLVGQYTEDDMDAYSTWVDEKEGKKTLASYQNLSAADIVISRNGDTIFVDGTLNLATNKGQEAIVTIALSTIAPQEWGEWADYAPFEKNTGKYYMGVYKKSFTKVPVQTRKDNFGAREFKLIGLGAGYFSAAGTDLVIAVDGKNVCSIAPTLLVTGYTLLDGDSYTGTYGTSTFDAENGQFNMKNILYVSGQGGYWSKDTLWMDKPISERDTVRLSAQGVTIQETTDKTTGKHTGWLYYNTATPGYETVLLQSVGEPKYGTFSYADKTLGSNYYNLMSTEGENQQFQEGTITVGEVGDSIVLDGICIGEDEKAYVLHFAQANKVLNYDTDAPFDANYTYNEMEASIEDGVISIYARNNSTGIGLELYADPAATTIPAGVYTIDTTKAAGTALQSVGVEGGYLTKCYAGNLAATGGIQDCFFMVSGTITLSYDEYGKLNVAVNALNSYDQPVTATVKYTKLTAKDTVQVRDVEFFIGDEYQEDYGVYYYEILDGIAIVGNLFAYTDTIFGDFKDVIDFGDCVLYDQAFNKRSVIDVDVFTVYAEGKNMTLTAKVLGSDTILYDIVATGYLGGLLWDAKEDYEGTFAYETITLTQPTKTQVMINSGSAAMQDTVALVIDGKLNKSGKLAAGEYKGVMASTGLTEEYQITPSFTGNTSGNWYIQSGKLTVNEDESMVFVGVNSYDKNVTINFGAKPTALKEVNANETIVKFFDGNKIVIRKGDKLFNILGEEL